MSWEARLGRREHRGARCPQWCGTGSLGCLPRVPGHGRSWAAFRGLRIWPCHYPCQAQGWGGRKGKEGGFEGRKITPKPARQHKSSRAAGRLQRLCWQRCPSSWHHPHALYQPLAPRQPIHHVSPTGPCVSPKGDAGSCGAGCVHRGCDDPGWM